MVPRRRSVEPVVSAFSVTDQDRQARDRKSSGADALICILLLPRQDMSEAWGRLSETHRDDFDYKDLGLSCSVQLVAPTVSLTRARHCDRSACGGICPQAA